jgi:spore coat protein U-like protein
MTNGVTTLEYMLYSDAAHTTIWGQTDGSDSYAGTGTGVSATNVLTVYGRIPNSAPNQVAVIGSYTDLVTATVFY